MHFFFFSLLLLSTPSTHSKSRLHNLRLCASRAPLNIQVVDGNRYATSYHIQGRASGEKKNTDSTFSGSIAVQLQMHDFN